MYLHADSNWQKGSTRCFHLEVAGVKDVCISMPTVIGKRGVHDVLYPKLDDDESLLLKESVEKMKKFSDEALALIKNN